MPSSCTLDATGLAQQVVELLHGVPAELGGLGRVALAVPLAQARGHRAGDARGGVPGLNPLREQRQGGRQVDPHDQAAGSVASPPASAWAEVRSEVSSTFTRRRGSIRLTPIA